MPEFSTIIKMVAALAVFSAFLAVAVTALNAFVPMPLAADLVHAFIESFKACIIGILGLLGGRAATSHSRRG